MAVYKAIGTILHDLVNKRPFRYKEGCGALEEQIWIVCSDEILKRVRRSKREL